MITEIRIRNFKGIGDEVTIPIRPITLLFGPNSAGKSSILHAFAYASELLERHNTDPDVTNLTGEAVDLGGFDEFVHRHERDRTVRLAFGLDMLRTRWHTQFPVNELGFQFGEELQIDVSEMGLDVATAEVALEVGYTETDGLHPVILGYEVKLDGRRFAMIDCAPQSEYESSGALGGKLTYLNTRHPAITWPGSSSMVTDAAGPIDAFISELRCPIERLYYSEEWGNLEPVGAKGLALSRKDENLILCDGPWTDDDFDTEALRCVKKELADESRFYEVWVGPLRQTGALAVLFAEFRRSSGWTEESAGREWTALNHWLDDDDSHCRELLSTTDALPPVGQRLELGLHEDPRSDQKHAPEEIRFVEELLTRLIMGPAAVLRNALRAFRYVGPFRQLPERTHVPPRRPDARRWATGLAAWDLLAQPDSDDLVAETSEWLSRTDRLDTGYTLISEDVREISETLQKALLQSEYDADDPAGRHILQDIERLPQRRTVYLLDIEKDTRVHPQGVGVGLSQVIPVIVACLAEGASTVQIEQPGLHLHPKQQVALGDLLIEAAKGRGGAILVETHSEHLLLRLLRRVREAKDRSSAAEDLTVAYVKPGPGGVHLTLLPVTEDGDFGEPWPDGFFAERDSELF